MSERVGVEERYAVFPFYLCLDASASMAGAPMDSVNRQLPLLRSSIGEDPAVAEVIRFGVVTFSDAAHTLLPLADLSMVEAVPPVAAQGRTSYAAAFDHLRGVIEDDYHAGRAGGDRWYRPAVLLISDGRPTDDRERWQAAHARLVDPTWKRHPNILSFGFGDADPAVLAQVSESKPNRAFIAAEGAEPAAVIPELMAGLIQSIVSSSASVYTGEAQLVPPELASMTPIPVDPLDSSDGRPRGFGLRTPVAGLVAARRAARRGVGRRRRLPGRRRRRPVVVPAGGVGGRGAPPPGRRRSRGRVRLVPARSRGRSTPGPTPRGRPWSSPWPTGWAAWPGPPGRRRWPSPRPAPWPGTGTGTGRVAARARRGGADLRGGRRRGGRPRRGHHPRRGRRRPGRDGLGRPGR